MTPAERRKLKEDRAKLTGYRNRLMLLKDTVPNINVLWQDNSKIVKFFESGEAAKYEAKLKGNTGKPLDKKPKPLKVKTELTVELFKDLKAKGVNDRTIMAEYGMHSNQLTAWKKANGLTGIRLDGGRPAHKNKQAKPKTEAKKVTVAAVEMKVDGTSEIKSLLKEAKDKIESLETELADYKGQAHHWKDAAETLEKELEETNILASGKTLEVTESKTIRKSMEDEIEQLRSWNSKISEQLELAQKAERQAIDELIVFQAEYRNLEVDYRNQFSEVDRLKAMLDKLKRTEQINVWLMEQHVGFVAQLDEVFER